MNNEENTEDYVQKMIVDEKDKNNGLQENSLSQDKGDKNLEEDLLTYVAKSKAIFKSQQKSDPDLSFEEKIAIARNVLQNSNCLFLSKFGHYMKKEHLKYFESIKNKDYEVEYHYNRLQRYFNSSKRQTDIRNRRYQALKILIEQGEYFSESEMMKRNPLLYEHLIGQYMTEKQKQIRDNLDIKNITFVNLLMEKIDRDSLKKKQKLQEEEEQCVLEENDSDEDTENVCTSNDSMDIVPFVPWGGTFKSQKEEEYKVRADKNRQNISKAEKQILKQEFVSNMYQDFLDGKDIDFDYSTVDDNEAYDNIDLRTQDEEDKYFDSESPETIVPTEDTIETETEDELDLYMKSLKEPLSTSTISLDNLVCDDYTQM